MKLKNWRKSDGLWRLWLTLGLIFMRCLVGQAQTRKPAFFTIQPSNLCAAVMLLYQAQLIFEFREVNRLGTILWYLANPFCQTQRRRFGFFNEKGRVSMTPCLRLMLHPRSTMILYGKLTR